MNARQSLQDDFQQAVYAFKCPILNKVCIHITCIEQ